AHPREAGLARRPQPRRHRRVRRPGAAHALQEARGPAQGLPRDPHGPARHEGVQVGRAGRRGVRPAIPPGPFPPACYTFPLIFPTRCRNPAGSAPMTPLRLPFEKEIYELEDLLARLEGDANAAASEEVRRIRRELVNIKRKIYSSLTPWQTVQVSRHRDRPQTCDYIDLIFDEFVELHGDRAIGDDRAIRTGFARLGDFRVLLVGHQKGHTLNERAECLYACAHPERYPNAL